MLCAECSGSSAYQACLFYSSPRMLHNITLYNILDT
jgi:hypothetical protein